MLIQFTLIRLLAVDSTGKFCFAIPKSLAFFTKEEIANLIPFDAPSGVSQMMTPEAAKISQEKEVDLTLSGVINKNKEEE